MTYSPLTNEATDTFQKSARTGSVGYFQLHHNAGTDGRGVVNMMTSGSRQVSANYVVLSDGTAIGVVPEEYRAWTSGSATYDSMAITFEIENSAYGGSWPVSGEAHAKVAAIIAEASIRYGIPVNRNTVYGHNEMLPRWGVSYATACPGGLQIDWIVQMANDIIAGKSSAARRNREDMPYVTFRQDGNKYTYALYDMYHWEETSDNDTAVRWVDQYGPYQTVRASVWNWRSNDPSQKANKVPFPKTAPPTSGGGNVVVDNTKVLEAIDKLPTLAQITTAIGASASSVINAVKGMFGKAGS